MANAVLEIFLWAFGLCAGSFLNVVIYRLPAGLSIADPPRSFCPRCRGRIAWYDNLPLLSWFWLGGRCRRCGGAISVQYPLVEGLTGLLFVLIYHLLFVVQARAGLVRVDLPADLPLLLAWLALGIGLVACAVMDIASYMVDIRITNVVLAAGVLITAAWPRGEFLVPSTRTPLAAATTAAFLVSGLMLWWTLRREPAEVEEPATPLDVPAAPTAAGSRTTHVAAVLGTLLTVALAGWLVGMAGAGSRAALSPVAAAAALAVAFAATVLSGGQARAADEEIEAAIEEEQPRARVTAWRELQWLTPALVAGVATFFAVSQIPALGSAWGAAAGWTPGGRFVPVAGAVYAIEGAILAAGVGWVLRIVFTLALGREAFGVGDIYILGAAGAAAGGDIALLGLLLSVGIALAGWLVGLLLKRTVMIPFGPWLALGFLLALWWSRSAHTIADEYQMSLVVLWRQFPGLLLVIVGLLLVGTLGALAFARLVRRWVAPNSL